MLGDMSGNASGKINAPIVIGTCVHVPMEAIMAEKDRKHFREIHGGPKLPRFVIWFNHYLQVYLWKLYLAVLFDNSFICN